MSTDEIDLMIAVVDAARAVQCKHCRRGEPRTDTHNGFPASYHGYVYNECTTPQLTDALVALYRHWGRAER